MKIYKFTLILLSLQLLAGCKETMIIESQLNNDIPAIISIDPDMGGKGTTVAIEGLGFSATASENIVTFNGVAATVEEASSTRLITTVPVGISTGPVNVQTDGETAIGPIFTLDSRLAFIGEYQAEDYEIRVTVAPGSVDTTVTVESTSDIDIDLIGRDSDNIKIDIKEFLEEGFKEGLLAVSPNTEFFGILFVLLDQPIAIVRGDQCKISAINFEITDGNARLLGEFSGSGMLIDSEAVLLRFEYKLVADGSTTYLFQGEVVLEKQ